MFPSDPSKEQAPQGSTLWCIRSLEVLTMQFDCCGKHLPELACGPPSSLHFINNQAGPILSMQDIQLHHATQHVSTNLLTECLQSPEEHRAGMPVPYTVQCA